jgi:hypothetical protein
VQALSAAQAVQTADGGKAYNRLLAEQPTLDASIEKEKERKSFENSKTLSCFWAKGISAQTRLAVLEGILDNAYGAVDEVTKHLARCQSVEACAQAFVYFYNTQPGRVTLYIFRNLRNALLLIYFCRQRPRGLLILKA